MARLSPGHFSFVPCGLLPDRSRAALLKTGESGTRLRRELPPYAPHSRLRRDPGGETWLTGAATADELVVLFAVASYEHDRELADRIWRAIERR